MRGLLQQCVAAALLLGGASGGSVPCDRLVKAAGCEASWVRARLFFPCQLPIPTLVLPIQSVSTIAIRHSATRADAPRPVPCVEGQACCTRLMTLPARTSLHKNSTKML